MKPPDKYLCKHTEYQEFYDVLPKVQTTFFRTGRRKSNGCFIIVWLEDLYNYFLWAKVSQEDLGPGKVCVKVEIGGEKKPTLVSSFQQLLQKSSSLTC